MCFGSRLLTLTLVVAGLSGLALAPAAPRKGVRYREPALTADQRSHWAFRPPTRPPVPRVSHSGEVRTPVDAFILARLEKAGLDLAPPAGRAALLRRVTFDLTGLPPTPAELDHFLHDARAGAYARVVDRLLASPRYGERWAQHWLDVVRYAESNGYEVDGERPHAWRYRDYVIRSFNQDKPYDQFVREQLAGDLLWKDEGGRMKDEKGKQNRSGSSFIPHPSSLDPLIAAGFNRCGPVHLVSGNLDPEVQRQEVLTEMTGAVGATFLGLTIGCARCHDHKFDPISQGDYYRLEAFFAAAQPRDMDISTAAERAAYRKKVQALQTQLEPLRQQVHRLDAPYQKRLREAKVAALEPVYRQALAGPASKRTAAQRRLVMQAEPLIKVTWDEVLKAMTPAERQKRAELRARIHQLTARMPPPPAHAWTLHDEGAPPPTHVLLRGSVKRKDLEVKPAFPRILAPAAKEGTKRLDRIALADWLTRPDHPLTARVIVNRLWQHHFGRGLVATPNDFGFRGEAPTHPELLDWLATELVSHRWSLKHMHRLIVLSSTYRQAGRASSPRAKKVDPNNRLLWHMPRRRLEGEALRDAALAVAGTLNPKMGGPMVRVPLEPAVYELIFTEGEPDGLWLPDPDVREHHRRSIYLFAKRNLRLPLLEAFDRPDTLTSCPVRPVSTFAPQALILLNGPFLQEQSKRFASRLLHACGPDPDRQIELAYRLALSRPPRPVERALAREFLTTQAALLRKERRAGPTPARVPDVPPTVEPAEAPALADFCLALMNCNEFLYVE